MGGGGTHQGDEGKVVLSFVTIKPVLSSSSWSHGGGDLSITLQPSKDPSTWGKSLFFFKLERHDRVSLLKFEEHESSVIMFDVAMPYSCSHSQ